VLSVGSRAHRHWGWATAYAAPQQWLAESVDLGGQQDDGVGCTIEWAGYCAGAVFGCFEYACDVGDTLIGLFIDILTKCEPIAGEMRISSQEKGLFCLHPVLRFAGSVWSCQTWKPTTHRVSSYPSIVESLVTSFVVII
jgi:hypothetical protein